MLISNDNQGGFGGGGILGGGGYTGGNGNSENSGGGGSYNLDRNGTVQLGSTGPGKCIIKYLGQ